MKRKIVLILLCIFMLNIVAPGALWAKSDYKVKDFIIHGLIKNDKIPPGLIKNGKIDPERLQSMMFNWKGEVEGEIVYKTTVKNNEWIVLKTKEGIKSLMLSTANKYSVGDRVEVEYVFDKIIEIEMIDEDDDDDEDEEDRYKNSLSYGLKLSSNKIYEGEKINFNLEVKNNTNKDISTRFNSGQRYDFIVKKDGKKVWRWSDNYDFITVIQNSNFTPGAKETYSAEWVADLAGDYTVEAFFMGQSSTTPIKIKKFTVANKSQDSNLQYKLDIVKGAPNLFILKVTNPLDKAIDVTIPTGQNFDFLLKKNGQKVWQYSDGLVFTQAIQKVKFQAKETKIYYAQYNTIPKGEYQLYGFFKGEGAKTIGPKTFTVK